MDGPQRQELDLPGFRFHPTEEELVGFYLTKEALGKAPDFPIIGTLNLYHYNPWELPEKAKIGEREWYFFVPRDRRNQNGRKPNRIAKGGFWKATGTDRQVRSGTNPRCIIGIKKTLVYYTGKAPRGCKTDWIMNEYRMPDNYPQPKRDIVLCKIYRKAASHKVLEQRALASSAMEMNQGSHSTTETGSPSGHEFSPNMDLMPGIIEDGQSGNYEVSSQSIALLHQEITGDVVTDANQNSRTSFRTNLPQLQLPRMDYTQDPFLAQIHSPWMDTWNPASMLIETIGSHFSPTLLYDPQFARDL